MSPGGMQQDRWPTVCNGGHWGRLGLAKVFMMISVQYRLLLCICCHSLNETYQPGIDRDREIQRYKGRCLACQHLHIPSVAGVYTDTEHKL